MEELIDYNFLIIGKSGSGKSATSKLLTGDPSIEVANSINEVTKSVKFYRGVSHFIEGNQIRFGILDIPGLDKITNRFTLRETILDHLEKFQISLHGIIYVASMTERDTMDQEKLFHFINQLPWSSEAKKSSLLPILTKYDNLIIDSPDEDIERTKAEFQKLFKNNGFASCWNKRIYWVNVTKSLDLKLKMNEDIREKHEKQIERLVKMVKENQEVELSSEFIKDYIKKEEKYVLSAFLNKLSKNEIPFKLKNRTHRVPLHVKIEPSKINESLTAISASSIGLFLARVFKHDFPFPITLIMMGIPLTLTFVNLISSGRLRSAEKINQEEFVNEKIGNSYARIFSLINEDLELEWKELNKRIEFSVEGKTIVCNVHKNQSYKFFALQNMEIREETRNLEFIECENNEQSSTYKMNIGELECDAAWEAVIKIDYEVKEFEEISIIKEIEQIRSNFNQI